MTPDQINNVKSHHTASVEGLFEILKTRKLVCKWPFLVSILFTGCALLAFILNCDKSYGGIKELSELVTICFPCLLGFSLAGYAMVVGFPNTELIQDTSNPNGYTLYQVLSSFFGLSIILQVIATALAFCIVWFTKIEITDFFPACCTYIYSVINITLITILLFISLYAIGLTPYIAINLFSLSQVNSMFFTVKKIKMLEREQQENEQKKVDEEQKKLDQQKKQIEKQNDFKSRLKK